MTSNKDELDHLRLEASLNLAYGAVADAELVTNDDGDCPIVVALDWEPLSIMLGRVRAVGGYGTIFSRNAAGAVRMLSVIQGNCALTPVGDALTPGAGATVGGFWRFMGLIFAGIYHTGVGHFRSQ